MCALPPIGVALAARCDRHRGGRCGARWSADGIPCGSADGHKLCRHAACRACASGAPVHAAPAEPHREWQRACGYRAGWLRSGSDRAVCLCGRPQHGASCPVCRDPSGSGRWQCPLFGRNGRGVERGPGPVKLVRIGQALEQGAMWTCFVKMESTSMNQEDLHAPSLSTLYQRVSG